MSVFVDGMYALNQDNAAFREHVRDFLVQIKVRLGWSRVIICSVMAETAGSLLTIDSCDGAVNQLLTPSLPKPLPPPI